MMKRKREILIIITGIAFLTVVSWIVSPSIGMAEVISETRDVPKFHSIRLSVHGDVTVTQGTSQSLEIRADDDVMPRLKTKVKNGTLVISATGIVRGPALLEIDIEMEEIKGLHISGSGTIKFNNSIEADSVSLKISGSGSIILELDASDIDTNISGSGAINLSGTVRSHTIEINGSGDMKAFDLKTEETSVRISGSGDCKVNVSENLDVKISGSGDLEYRGSPNVSFKGSGSGTMKSVE
jgi:hypothetical protein